MPETYRRIWWSFITRGLIAILFGLVALLLPGITVDVLVLLLGAFFFADGVLSIFAAFGSRGDSGRVWLALLEGLAGIVLGILTFFWPQVTLTAVVWLVAAWALITGVVEIVAAIRLRKTISKEWLLGLSGAVSILFGLLLLVNPGVGAVALVWIIGAYALFFGLLLVLLGIKLRKVMDVD